MAKSSDTVSNYLSLLSEIESKRFVPIYLLHGDETYFIDSLTDALENNVLPEAERSFNQSVVYGKDIKMADLIAMVKRYPMMSDYQLIVVKDAQDLKEWDLLLNYVENPLKSTILVLAFRNAKMDLRTKTGKAIASHKEFNSAKLRDYQIANWLPKFAQSKGRSIDVDAIERIKDLLGSDLQLIHNELEKIFVTVKEEFIRASHVEEHVGFNREYNVFELQTAIGQRNFNKSVQIAHQMGIKSEKGDLMRMVPVLFGFFTKIVALHCSKANSKNDLAQEIGVSPFFMDDYLSAKSNYSLTDLEWAISQMKYLDLRLKGVHRGAATDGELLVEAVVNILKRTK